MNSKPAGSPGSSDPAQTESRHTPAFSSIRLRPAMGPPPPIPDHELLRPIGRGSYGEVWLARNVMGAYRAVKIIYRQAFEHERPFQREFEGIRNFDPVSRTHHSQVAILHVGRNAGSFYYVMELADPADTGAKQTVFTGQDWVEAVARSSDSFDAQGYVPHTLKHDLNHHRQLPFEECLRIGSVLTTALEHLHKHGLVHRDIKPSNIIFVNGLPKLADIGLVTSMDATLSFVGTMGYVPPEGPGTPQADIYSLGKVLYEASMGRDRQDFPKLPADLDPGPASKDLVEFNAVLLKACEADPARRYASAREMHSELQLLQSGRSVARLRRLEKRLAQGKRLVSSLLVLLLLAGGAFYHTWRTARMTRQSLSRQHVKQGADLMENNQLLESLPYFTEALRLDPENAEVNRIRIASVLRHCPKPIGVFAHEEGKLLDAGFSPDGNLLLTVGADQTVRLWNLHSKGAERSLAHDQPLLHAEFSLDSRFLVTLTGDKQAHLWDVTSGRELRPPLPHQCYLLFESYSATLSQDGYFLAKNHDDRRLVESGQLTNKMEKITLRLTLTGGQDQVDIRFQCLDRERAGALLIDTKFTDTSQFDPLSLNVDTGRSHLGQPGVFAMVVRLNNKMGSASPAALVVDGLRVEYSDATTTNCSSEDLGRPDFSGWTVEGGAGTFLKTNNALVFSAGSNLYTMFPYVAKNSPVRTIRQNSTLIYEVDVAHLSSPVQGVTLGFFISSLGNLASSLPPRFSPDGRHLLTLTSPASVAIWDLSASESKALQLDHERWVQSMAFTPDGRWVVTIASFGHLHIWDARSGQLRLAIPLGIGRFTIPLSFQGQWMAIGYQRSDAIQIFNLADGSPHGPLLVHQATARGCAFSPDARRLLTFSEDKKVCLWEVQTGRALDLQLGPFARINQAGFSPDGRWIFVFDGQRMILFDSQTGEKSPVQILADGLPREQVFNPAGWSLATLHDGQSVRVWDLSKIDPLVLELDAMPNSHSTSSGGTSEVEQVEDRTIRIRAGDAAHQPLAVIQTEKDVVRVGLTSDNRWLIAEYSDETGQVWSPADGQPLTPFLPVRYGMTRGPDSKLALAPTDWSLADLESSAEFLAGTGGIEGAGRTEAMIQAWESLRKNQSDEFSFDEATLLAWHQAQANHAEQTWDWPAALFHLGRLNELVSESPSYSRRHQYARLALDQEKEKAQHYRERHHVIPPRDPTADPGLLDLTELYTHSLKQPRVVLLGPLWPEWQDRAWRDLPSLIQHFHGTPFDVRGIVEVSDAPIRIPVGRRLDRLHFLHATAGVRSRDPLAGQYLIHYQNGEPCSLPLRVGRELLSSLSPASTPSPSDGQIVWMGSSQDLRQKGFFRSLTQWTCENPNPDWIVESIEVVNERAGLILVAVTAE